MTTRNQPYTGPSGPSWPPAITVDKRRRPTLPTGPSARWQDDAGCIDAPEEFVDTNDAGQLAARYCSTCPVLGTCAAYGATTRATGIWGGVLLVDGVPVPSSGDVAA